MKKYFVAKQIAPEYQESPMFLSRDFEDFNNWEDVSFFGNNHLIERKTPILEEILDCIDDACMDYFKFINEYSCCPYESISEIVKEYFPSSKSTMETEWEEVFTTWPDSRKAEERNILCNILSLVAGKEFDWKQITGSCQSDWQYIYYPAEKYNEKALDALEAEYFNEGTEWMLFEEPVEIEEGGEEKAADLAEDEGSFSFSVYCISWNDEEKRKEIADAIGCDPEEVLLFEFDHYKKTPIYKLA